MFVCVCVHVCVCAWRRMYFHQCVCVSTINTVNKMTASCTEAKKMKLLALHIHDSLFEITSWSLHLLLLLIFFSLFLLLRFIFKHNSCHTLALQTLHYAD